MKETLGGIFINLIFFKNNGSIKIRKILNTLNHKIKIICVNRRINPRISAQMSAEKR